ncbi:MAG TPA: EAL domain-containing protein, partial [Acidobacteriaceae bacterium]|nr:EAL domain-containing protein [Acidobacteriaceae bacterium]
NLGISVIAEGVETMHQLKTVRALGIKEAQGFLLGRPDVDPEALIRKAGAVLQRKHLLAPEARIGFALCAATQESGDRK